LHHPEDVWVFAAQAADEGKGVNLLPIALVLIAIGVGVYLWLRSRRSGN
jgi:hypothetical protein